MGQKQPLRGVVLHIMDQAMDNVACLATLLFHMDMSFQTNSQQNHVVWIIASSSSTGETRKERRMARNGDGRSGRVGPFTTWLALGSWLAKSSTAVDRG